MAIDARRTLIFREIAKAGSISGAARALGWTQPAVSQHLARLEREAGGPLLLRGPGGVTLTEAGAALLRRAHVVAAELHAAAEELAALTQLEAGRVRLVSFPTAAATLVPEALGALADEHPEIEVELHEAEPPEALAAVAAGDADLALVFGYDGPPADLGPLVWRRLLDEPVHLVLPPGSRAPGRRGLAAFEDADWIAGCVRCRTHLIDICTQAGFTPAIRHTTDDYVVVQNLVARGLGVTVLPDSALSPYRHPDVRVIPMRSLGRRHVGVAHRPGGETVPATAALLQQIARAALSAGSVRQARTP
ncbi:LysR family transcriptional regulator [Aeromicrobium wangtongii]|uniref:LysR family transcriptional regulator n=1 Tax=Aeromicrobium wangtongii TaxID=2969247 RepID=A0ABY5M6S9_9ACTN|nr:LysR family transcriptional regulator [Aeromicrobium wangtongii]MCD9198650.1 LysR family transcriptional regulator [Aeromicrobium wangtongii]UUP12674.1 LysR family transcriptional regulator [Aeromicrobium wangtongii]